MLLSKYNLTGTWSVGDFNYDGSVTGADLSLLLSKYNQSIPASVAGAAVAGVPEPSSLVMLATLAAAMGLGVAGRRRFAARRLLRTFRVSILKEVPMKRVLILSACIVMSSALIARAGVMPFGTFTKGGESVAVDYTRTAQTGALAGLDLVILSVDSINGAGSSSINGMVSAGVGNPTFTGLNGSYMYICDPGAVYITNAFPANFTAPGSYINFDSVSGAFAGTLKSGRRSSLPRLAPFTATASGRRACSRPAPELGSAARWRGFTYPTTATFSWWAVSRCKTATC